MDKKKQIEEMAKAMLEYGMEKYPTETSVFTEVKLREQFYSVFLTYAEHLYNAGYRKIPELPQETVLTVDDIAELLTIVARETRKKTARKFAKVFKTKLFDLGNVVTETDIDEICKEFTIDN